MQPTSVEDSEQKHTKQRIVLPMNLLSLRSRYVSDCICPISVGKEPANTTDITKHHTTCGCKYKHTNHLSHAWAICSIHTKTDRRVLTSMAKLLYSSQAGPSPVSPIECLNSATSTPTSTHYSNGSANNLPIIFYSRITHMSKPIQKRFKI